jgi:hypothetical protein
MKEGDNFFMDVSQTQSFPFSLLSVTPFAFCYQSGWDS